MKKLIVGEKWKRYLASRSRHELRAKTRFTDYRRRKAKSHLGHARPKHFKKDGIVSGPRVFSIIHNPIGMIDFFDQMEHMAKRRNVIVNLSNVESMTPDAIAGLLAAIHRCKSTGAHVKGNVPRSAAPKKMLNESGFRNYVHSRVGAREHAEMGRIARFTRSSEAFNNRFDQFLATDLIQFANQRLRGQALPHQPSYSVFSEAMLNTWNHASRSEDSREPWWASVYVDEDRHCACFTFLDRGVGIFGSHNLTLKLSLLSNLRVLNSAQLLKQIFKGEIPSTTREAGRGNGIPGMYAHCRAGRIKNLTIISNHANGNAESETYVVLPKEFVGTLLYWEIGL